MDADADVDELHSSKVHGYVIVKRSIDIVSQPVRRVEMGMGDGLECLSKAVGGRRRIRTDETLSMEKHGYLDESGVAKSGHCDRIFQSKTKSTP